MTKIPLLTTDDQLTAWLKRSEEGKVLLFKHSTACPISATAFQELESFLLSEVAKNVETAMVHVIEHRAISNAIAERLGVKHESPQALLIEAGQVLWHTSHWDITQDALAQAVNNAQQK